MVPPGSAQADSETIYHWLDSNGRDPDVVIAVADGRSNRLFIYALDSYFNSPSRNHTTVIWLPQDQLEYLEWSGTLTLLQWRSMFFFSPRLVPPLSHVDWHVPKLDLIVITNNRPESFRRLLGSLRRALFFGDRLHLHVNVEQTADEDTMSSVHALRWNHGDLHIRHRVILGGLLPAIVESWYPSSNDSYGLILEDDVEVSPMFYAWVKMTLLQYR